MKNKEDRSRIQWIESLRGLFFLFVFVAHLGATNTKYAMYFNGCGKIGVWGFMLFSGYFLMYPYKDLNADGGFTNIWEFYKKKLLRIWPLYLITLVFEVASQMITVKDVIPHLFGIQGYAHFWYMAVLIRLYIVFPLFILTQRIIKNRQMFCVGLIVTALIFSVIFPYTKCPENDIHLRWYLPVFILGMLLAFVIDIKKENESSKGWDVVAILAFGIILSMTPLAREMMYGAEPSTWLQNKYVYMSVLWSVIIGSTYRGVYVKKFLNHIIVLSKIGKVSFELYLVHFAIIFVYAARIENMILRVIISTAISYGVAILLYSFDIWLKNKNIKKMMNNKQHGEC